MAASLWAWIRAGLSLGDLGLAVLSEVTELHAK
jgi:hypothetical protein